MRAGLDFSSCYKLVNSIVIIGTECSKAQNEISQHQYYDFQLFHPSLLVCLKAQCAQPVREIACNECHFMDGAMVYAYGQLMYVQLIGIYDCRMSFLHCLTH